MYLTVQISRLNPVSILYKSTAVRYRPVGVANGSITAWYRFIKNASWEYGKFSWTVCLHNVFISSIEVTTQDSVTPSFTISSALRTNSQTGSPTYSATVGDTLYWTIDIPCKFSSWISSVKFIGKEFCTSNKYAHKYAQLSHITNTFEQSEHNLY